MLKNFGKWIAGLVVVVGVIAGLAAATKPTKQVTDVARLIQAYQYESGIVAANVAGCAAAANDLGDPRLLEAMVMSQGQVCMQLTGEQISRAVNGKSICAKGDEKCLFAAGYSATLFQLVAMPSSEEQIQDMQNNIDAAYNKYKAVQTH